MQIFQVITSDKNDTFDSAEAPEGQRQLMTQSVHPVTKTQEGKEERVTEGMKG